ncbi:hypothetical protein VTK26DRAFT_2074 [Humicola hyalothermophila]
MPTQWIVGSSYTTLAQRRRRLNVSRCFPKRLAPMTKLSVSGEVRKNKKKAWNWDHYEGGFEKLVFVNREIPQAGGIVYYILILSSGVCFTHLIELRKQVPSWYDRGRLGSLPRVGQLKRKQSCPVKRRQNPNPKGLREQCPWKRGNLLRQRCTSMQTLRL